MVSDCHTDLPRSMYTFSLYRLLYESTVIDRPSSKPENCFFVRLKSLNGQNKAKGTEHVALAQRGICSSKLRPLLQRESPCLPRARRGCHRPAVSLGPRTARHPCHWSGHHFKVDSVLYQVSSGNLGVWLFVFSMRHRRICEKKKWTLMRTQWNPLCPENNYRGPY